MKNIANTDRPRTQAEDSSEEVHKTNHLNSRDRERELERGSIESGLVLIPTTLFFLMILQVLLAGSWQTIERAKLHDMVIENSIKDSLSTNLRNSDKEIESSQVQLFEGSLSAREEYVGMRANKTRSLSISQQATPVGTIQLVEMSTDIPILGDFFRAMDGSLFRVSNRAVSFVS
jgi:hypothetical protein